MSQRSEAVFVCNADTAIGEAIVRDMLMGEKRQSFPYVKASVHKVARSGDLWALGCTLVEVSSSEPDMRRLEEELKDIRTLVLVPNCGSQSLVHQAKAFLCAAKRAGVQNCLLISLLGVGEGQDQNLTRNETWKNFHMIEKLAREEGPENLCILRKSVLQQNLFWHLCEIKEQRRISMPLKENAKFAPINLWDLACFTVWVIAESGQQSFTSGGGNIYKLTGPEATTPKQIVEQVRQNAGVQIEYRRVNRDEARKYLQEELYFNDAMVQEALDLFELIEAGRMSEVSGDQKKSGKKPTDLGEFIKRHSFLFKPRREHQG